MKGKASSFFKEHIIELICVFIIFLFSLIIVWVVHNNNHYEEKEYSLSEIEPGIYCIYNTVSSSVPADNYEVATLCCNGQVVTLKGYVSIIYSSKPPHATIKDYNIVNADRITIYIPNNTVKFQENVGLG